MAKSKTGKKTIDAVAEQKCPQCGAPLIFDPEKGDMYCEYCGTRSEIITPEKLAEEDTEELTGFDLDSLTEQATMADSQELPIYNCSSCAAELIAPPAQFALTCPYCGNNIVLTEKASGNLRPDAVIPFKITPKVLPTAVKRFYKGKVLLLGRFFSENTMGKVTGVYVPFWVFSGSISGTLRFTVETSSSTRKGYYIHTTTKHYALEREVSMAFENVPVDASGRIDDKLMDSLEPFDLREARPYDIKYLAGYTAERFDEKKSAVTGRAQNRMFATADNAVRKKITGYSNVKRTGGNLNADFTARYILFPAYLFSVSFDGQKYEFAVNGQTGKVCGNLPIDKKVCVKYFLLRMAGIAAVFILVFIIKYLIGG